MPVFPEVSVLCAGGLPSTDPAYVRGCSVWPACSQCRRSSTSMSLPQPGPVIDYGAMSYIHRYQPSDQVNLLLTQWRPTISTFSRYAGHSIEAALPVTVLPTNINIHNWPLFCAVVEPVLQCTEVIPKACNFLRLRTSLCPKAVSHFDSSCLRLQAYVEPMSPILWAGRGLEHWKNQFPLDKTAPVIFRR